MNKKTSKKNKITSNTQEYPISNNTMEYVESQIDKLNETDNLSEKINIHAKLTEYTKTLESEINSMIDTLDNINIDDAIIDTQTICDSTDIDDDIVNLNKMMENMQEEEIMQTKLDYLKKMITQVQKCKKITDNNKMSVTKINK